MLDLSGIENFEEAVREHATRTEAITFGITATTPQLPAAAKIAVAIRRVRPGARIICGGPHCTLVFAARRREQAKDQVGRACRAWDKIEAMFDCIVVGDGDDAIFEAIKPDASKVIDADDPKGKLFLTNRRYEELPFPARHLVDVGSYRYSIDGERALSMVSNLGCPFHCAFCGGRESPMLRRVRTRTPASVVAEMRHLHEVYGVTGVMDYADEINLGKGTVPLMRSIADLGKELDIQWKLRAFVKAELFTEEQAEAMYAAGFRWLLCGFESGSPRILHNIRKQATREDNTRMLQIAHKHGLKVKALMSVGHPAESAETITDTRDWLLEQKPDDFDLTCITVYLGTPYFSQAIESEPGIWTYTAENGDRLHSEEVDFALEGGYYKGKVGEYKSFVHTDYITGEQIVALRDSVEDEVRTKLGIPFNAGAPGARYEATTGQLPGFILRSSA